MFRSRPFQPRVGDQRLKLPPLRPRALRLAVAVAIAMGAGTGIAPLALAQSNSNSNSAATVTAGTTNAPSLASTNRARSSTNVVSRIRDEGLNRSQIMETLHHLTEVVGPRLTASPAFKRSAEWSRQRLESWGLTNSHLEPWGPFGRGWTLERYSAQVVAPHTFPVVGHPFAWSPGLSTPGPLVTNVVFLDAQSDAELEAYKGRLKGAIVMVSSTRDLAPHTEPDAVRVSDQDLLRLANANLSTSSFFPGTPNRSLPTNTANAAATEQYRRRQGTNAPGRAAANPGSGTRTNATVQGGRGAGGSRTNPPAGRPIITQSPLSFAAREGAAATLSASGRGDIGTFHVEQARVPSLGRATNSTPSPDSAGASTNAAGRVRRGPGGPIPGSVAAWATNAPAYPAQIQLLAEDYNRIARLIRQGQEVTMALDLQVKFHSDDLMGYNVIAEIPGTDLKDEIVMLGGHLDSWHAGTGATDNAAGVAVAMEAVRILKAVGAQPRRTVRIALWGGEEQGLYGSRAYVRQHFGYYTNLTNGTGPSIARSPKDDRGERAERAAALAQAQASATNAAAKSGTNTTANATAGSRTNAEAPKVTRKLIRHRDYDRLSVYFNLDNGTGRIRGIYAQNNEAAVPAFRKWIAPFRDLGAETVSLANTGSTDHEAFDAIGLPGFQFIQDPIEYWTRTHHSNMDTFDRLQPEDLKQAATIMATFVYQAATQDEKVPRKTLPNP